MQTSPIYKFRAGNTSTEHFILLKTWMRKNETKGIVGIFQAFEMGKFFDKEGLIDTLYTKGKISAKDYRMCFMLNNKTCISILTPEEESDTATIFNAIG